MSHNEETQPWNGEPFYMANREKLIAVAEHFHANGITWNMQSGWLYLTNVIIREVGPVTVNTCGKNILRWMHEDMGVEMDPHAHETTCRYPDVVG